MTIREWIQVKRVIRDTARRTGITSAQCRQDMAAAIDAAWASFRIRHFSTFFDPT